MNKKNLTVDWTATEEKLANGEIHKIEQFAAMIGVSRPTAKKLLAAQFGNRIVFTRGRSGGIQFLRHNTPVTA